MLVGCKSPEEVVEALEEVESILVGVATLVAVSMVVALAATVLDGG